MAATSLMRSLRTVVFVICTLGLIAGVVKLGFERAEYMHDWAVRERPWKVVVEDETFFEKYRDDDRFKRSEHLSRIQPHREGLKILDWPPTLASIEQLYTYDVPAWSWWNRAANQRHHRILQLQAILFPASANRVLHVNRDHTVGALVSGAVVTVLHADISGLRESVLVPASS